MNDKAVQSFPEEVKVYLPADRLAQGENEGAYPMELVNSMSPPGFAPHQLRLKVGIPVILLRNINLAQGLVNGTRAVIMHLSARVLQVYLRLYT
jgi:hypothetical protein